MCPVFIADQMKPSRLVCHIADSLYSSLLFPRVTLCYRMNRPTTKLLEDSGISHFNLRETKFVIDKTYEEAKRSALV